MASVLLFFYQKTLLLFSFFWVSLLGFVYRLKKNGGSSKGGSEQSKVVVGEINDEGSSPPLVGTNPEFVEFSSSESEKEETQFSFEFRFPTYEEFSKNRKDFAHLIDSEEVRFSAATAKRYEIKSGESFTRFVLPEPEDSSFEIKQVNSDSDRIKVLLDDDEEQERRIKNREVLLDEGLEQVEEKEEEEKIKNREGICGEDKTEGLEQVHAEAGREEEEKIENCEGICGEDETEEIGTSMEEKVLVFDAVQAVPEPENGDHVEEDPVHEETAEISTKEKVIANYDEESDPESIGSSTFHSYGDGVSPSVQFAEEEEEEEGGEFVGKEWEDGESGGKSESSKLESLWEHQELIEQLKMELKKARAIGLPTIMEESESPKMEDLKPWKIEELHQREDRGKTGELHKFYKSYRERMRKFDIFNYQKMYAIGFLQLKDPLQSISISKSSIPEITALFSQSFSTTKGKKHENDATVKFIKELQSDLEVVYVGQMCLSWEILQWQYEKVLDLWESDPRRVLRYNGVAGEFQQFQVLIQRFMENEPFQGPRIHNYVKSRCVLRNLLQVPVIRADAIKDVMKVRNNKGSAYDVSSDMLVEILEESIRLFWRFVRADKDRKPTQIEFEEPFDSQLFLEVQKDLQKKEKRLKDHLSLATAQAIELGLGLESSNRPFVWCLRHKTEGLERWFREEGYEERVRDRGLVIHGWAPQVLILSHRAIGGFLTHCGWNSTLEGISAGLPLLTWPHFAEQFLNEAFAVEVLKIGVRIGVQVPTLFGEEEKVGVLVKRDEIKVGVGSVMSEGGGGRERRERAKVLGEMAKRAMEEGGSSYLDMTRLIENVVERLARE